MIRLLEDWTITAFVNISLPAMLINPVQEGEDYGKGVIFYLRENKVMGGSETFDELKVIQAIIRYRIVDSRDAFKDKPTCLWLTEHLGDAGGWSASLECVQQNVNRQEVIHNWENCTVQLLLFSGYLRRVDNIIVLRILKEGRQYDDLTEVAKLFNIHATE